MRNVITLNLNGDHLAKILLLIYYKLFAKKKKIIPGR